MLDMSLNVPVDSTQNKFRDNKIVEYFQKFFVNILKAAKQKRITQKNLESITI